MALLRLSDFNIYWLIYRSLLLLLLYFGVIILVLRIYLWILSFTLILNMSRLITILYDTGLRRKRFKFVLSLLMINLQMSLLSCFLLLLGSNFGLLFHSRFEEAYYEMYIYKKYYRNYTNIVIFTFTIVYCPTRI